MQSCGSSWNAESGGARMGWHPLCETRGDRASILHAMKWLGISLGVLLLLVGGYAAYTATIANPRVLAELRDSPTGERAKKVMLLSLPSGRTLPVNYLREDGRVYAGADGRWWKELDGERVAVTLLVQGEKLHGRALAIRDAPAYTRDVFSRLRPTAIPGFGTLIEILLDPGDPGGHR